MLAGGWGAGEGMIERVREGEKEEGVGGWPGIFCL